MAAAVTCKGTREASCQASIAGRSLTFPASKAGKSAMQADESLPVSSAAKPPLPPELSTPIEF